MKMNKARWRNFSEEEIREILASIQDSDRYINEGLKNGIIEELNLCTEAFEQ